MKLVRQDRDHIAVPCGRWFRIIIAAESSREAPLISVYGPGDGDEGVALSNHALWHGWRSWQPEEPKP